MEWFEQNWKLLFAVIHIVFLVIVWALSKTFARKEDHSSLVKQVDKLDQEVKAMPGTERMHHLELQMKELSGELSGLSPLLRRVEHQTNLLLENELNGK